MLFFFCFRTEINQMFLQFIVLDDNLIFIGKGFDLGNQVEGVYTVHNEDAVEKSDEEGEGKVTG